MLTYKGFVLFIYLAASGLCCSVRALSWWHAGSLLQCMGFSLVAVHRPARAPGSVVAACSLSCPVECGNLVPLRGIQPVSPALEGGFLTAGPPGKSQKVFCFYFFVFF